MTQDKRNILVKNKDTLAKYSTILINLAYVIALGISAIILRGESFNKELAISFAPSIFSILAQFILTPPAQDLEGAKKHLLKVASENGDPEELQKMIDDITVHISAQPSARSEPIHQETREITIEPEITAPSPVPSTPTPIQPPRLALPSKSIPKPPARAPRVPMSVYMHESGEIEYTPRVEPQ